MAPMITPKHCAAVMSPADAKPTSSTVVTDDDCVMAVIVMPENAAEKRLPVSFASRRRMLSPAMALSASVMKFMPSRKIASPPTRPRVSVTRFVCASVSVMAIGIVPRRAGVRQARQSTDASDEDRWDPMMGQMVEPVD